ncbi:Hypothetical predicted protein [Paramuricea clavata]|uniref:Uncharacterized protein n=1 Tax=Paramuricea clavata TaxID=317549 RepID=A0A7D9IU50_PARCT|nr:Hypothetical predicted protein [Paramuricea clavata]
MAIFSLATSTSSFCRVALELTCAVGDVCDKGACVAVGNSCSGEDGCGVDGCGGTGVNGFRCVDTCIGNYGTGIDGCCGSFGCACDGEVRCEDADGCAGADGDCCGVDGRCGTNGFG